jgi:hypothetical protein
VVTVLVSVAAVAVAVVEGVAKDVQGIRLLSVLMLLGLP